MMRDIKAKAIVYAFDRAGLIVYSQILDLAVYYEGEHIWDSWERIKEIGIVRLVGALFDSAGGLSQEFEHPYDESTGRMLCNKAFYAREHLKTNEPYQKMRARFTELQRSEEH